MQKIYYSIKIKFGPHGRQTTVDDEKDAVKFIKDAQSKTNHIDPQADWVDKQQKKE